MRSLHVGAGGRAGGWDESTSSWMQWIFLEAASSCRLCVKQEVASLVRFFSFSTVHRCHISSHCVCARQLRPSPSPPVFLLPTSSPSTPTTIELAQSAVVWWKLMVGWGNVEKDSVEISHLSAHTSKIKALNPFSVINFMSWLVLITYLSFQVTWPVPQPDADNTSFKRAVEQQNNNNNDIYSVQTHQPARLTVSSNHGCCRDEDHGDLLPAGGDGQLDPLPLHGLGGQRHCLQDDADDCYDNDKRHSPERHHVSRGGGWGLRDGNGARPLWHHHCHRISSGNSKNTLAGPRFENEDVIGEQ